MSYPQVIEQSNQVLRELVDAGERVLGYIYPHFPLEIVLAHGLTPSLVRTSPSIVGAYEASLQTFSCALTRNLFSQRVNDSLPQLAGIVFPGNTCDALQNVGDVWRLRFPGDSVFRLTYPAGKPKESAVQFLAEEIRTLSRTLSANYGTTFSEDAFKDAATLIRRIRDGLQLLYATRLIQPSLVSRDTLYELVGDLLTSPTNTGLDRIERELAAASASIEEGLSGAPEKLKNALLSQNLEGLTVQFEDTRPRIAVIGGMIEPSTIAGLVNGVQGFTDSALVLDLLSFGFKTVFAPPVSTRGDPFDNAARSILGAPGEPTQEGLPKRTAFLRAILTKLSIHGLIICEQSFCDPDEFEAPSLERAAKEVGVATVKLPIDPELSDRARLEGRIQTFIETLESK